MEYNNCSDIKVKFKTGTIIQTQYCNFKNGKVRDPLFPNVCAIGYLGIGKYKAAINRKTTTEYGIWRGMIQRCYDPYCINKHQTYQDVFVCDEWLNFQNFAKWFYRNYYELIDERVNLDKDLIKIGNKLYCPEFCSFVPNSINTLLNKRNKMRGKYPIGVYFVKNKYETQIRINGKTKCIGKFSTAKEAFESYKIAKEKQIKIRTKKYEKVLNVKVFKNLIHHKILITD